MVAATTDAVDYGYTINILPYHGYTEQYDCAANKMFNLLLPEESEDGCVNSLSLETISTFIGCDDLEEETGGDCAMMTQYGFTMNEKCECYCVQTTPEPEGAESNDETVDKDGSLQVFGTF